MLSPSASFFHKLFILGAATQTRFKPQSLFFADFDVDDFTASFSNRSIFHVWFQKRVKLFSAHSEALGAMV